MSHRSTVDPTEWANKRKAAMERAKQIKEDRKNILNPSDTFTPTINKRPSSNSSQKLDNIDTFARSNDIMEQPLAAQRNKNNQYNPNDIMEQPLAAQRTKNNQYNPNDIMEQPLAAQRTKNNQFQNNDIMEQPLASQRNRNNQNINDDPMEQPLSAQRNKINTNFNNDIMEQPLAAQRNRNSQYPTEDILEQPLAAQKPKAQLQAPEVPKYKSKAMQEYMDNQSQDSSNDEFVNMLRADNPTSKSPRPSWNDDTTVSYPPDNFLSQNVKVQPRRSSSRIRAGRTIPISEEIVHNNQDEPPKPSRPPRTSSDSTVSQARNSLSLLKSKIRLTEGSSLKRTASSENNLSSNNSSSQFRQSMSAGTKPAGRPEWNSSFDEPEEDPTQNIIPKRNQQRFGDQNEQSIVQQKIPPRRHQFNFSEDQSEEQVQNKIPPRRRLQQQQQVPPEDQNEDQVYHKPPPRRQPIQQQQAPPEDQYEDQVYHKPPPRRQSSQQSEEFDEIADDNSPQHECPDCNRKFNAIAFEKHVKICQKVFMSKRKVFNSQAVRINANPELAKILAAKKKEEKIQERKNAKKEAPIETNEKENKWKLQSIQFREAMKAARAVSKAQAEGKPLPPPVISAPDPSLIQCPHCERRFNEKAAERHIPQCQNIKAKPKALMRNGGTNASTVVKKKK